MMASLPNLTPRILKNTLTLIQLYNTNLKFRELFNRLAPNPKTTFQGQPLKLYLRVITNTSLKYRRYEKEVRANIEKFKELLINFYKDSKEFSKFQKMVQEAVLGKHVQTNLTKEELELVAKIENTPEGKEKENVINQLEEKLRTSQPQEKINPPQEGTEAKKEPEAADEQKRLATTLKRPTIFEVPKTFIQQKIFLIQQNLKFPQFTLPKIALPKIQLPSLSKIQLPSFAKDLASSGQIAARKLIYRFGSNLFSGGVGGIVAAGLGGGPVGIMTGTLIGGIFPSALKNGTFRGILGGGSKAALSLGARGAALAAGPPGWIVAVALSAPQLASATKKILIAIGAGIFLLLFMDLNKINSLLPPWSSIGETAPLPPGEVPADIASCKFTRSDQTPKEATFKSNILLSYIQEAASKSTIPPVILAAFIRVESPSSVNYTDSNLSSMGCAVSQTGALGIMQLQPQGTRGHDKEAITQGAKLIGKNYNELTRDDYCDIKKSIIMGAGFILKKMSYSGYGDGSRWDPSWTNNRQAVDTMAKSYHGCLEYGGADPLKCDGPYNYGSDLWASIQNCKVLPTPPPGQPPQGQFALTCPIANEYNTCSDYYDPRDPCHCNAAAGFVSMNACAQDPSLYYGIDVGTKASSAALIPYIIYQGEATPQPITCRLIAAQSPTCPATGCEWQQILHYHCPTNKVDLYLQYNHIKANTNFPQIISSGQSVGDVANYGDGLRRLNIQVGVGGECAYGQTQFCKRGGEYFQCPLQKEPLDF